MQQLPKTENPIVLRTDFSDQTAWKTLRTEIEKPVDDFIAHVEFIDDKRFDGLTNAQLLKILSDDYEHSFIVIADKIALTPPDYALLIVDLYDEVGGKFRALPSQVQAIENNLSIANMDFAEFAVCAGEDEVFRGFSD